MQPLTQEQILRLVDRLDIPECGCKVEWLDCGCKRRAEEFRELAKKLNRELAATRGRRDLRDDLRQAFETDIGIDIRAAQGAATWWEDHHRLDCTPLMKWPPCEHVIKHFEKWPAGFTYEDYVELVSQLDPSIFVSRDQEWRMEHSYNDPPPPPPVNILALQHETRVALYADRHHKRLRLYSDSDLIDPSALTNDVGPVGGTRLKNGADRKGLGLTTVGAAVAKIRAKKENRS